ncbi:hypothetical protein HDU97_000540 [Phlyctochytrium planicorne]|nr:hypothetical protein HDU97_000540 [Phlyctochytrium planicorne]
MQQPNSHIAPALAIFGFVWILTMVIALVVSYRQRNRILRRIADLRRKIWDLPPGATLEDHAEFATSPQDDGSSSSTSNVLHMREEEETRGRSLSIRKNKSEKSDAVELEQIKSQSQSQSQTKPGTQAQPLPQPDMSAAAVVKPAISPSSTLEALPDQATTPSTTAETLAIVPAMLESTIVIPGGSSDIRVHVDESVDICTSEKEEEVKPEFEEKLEVIVVKEGELELVGHSVSGPESPIKTDITIPHYHHIPTLLLIATCNPRPAHLWPRHFLTPRIRFPPVSHLLAPAYPPTSAERLLFASPSSNPLGARVHKLILEAVEADLKLLEAKIQGVVVAFPAAIWTFLGFEILGACVFLVGSSMRGWEEGLAVLLTIMALAIGILVLVIVMGRDALITESKVELVVLELCAQRIAGKAPYTLDFGTVRERVKMDGADWVCAPLLIWGGVSRWWERRWGVRRGRCNPSEEKVKRLGLDGERKEEEEGDSCWKGYLTPKVWKVTVNLNPHIFNPQRPFSKNSHLRSGKHRAPYASPYGDLAGEEDMVNDDDDDDYMDEDETEEMEEPPILESKAVKKTKRKTLTRTKNQESLIANEVAITTDQMPYQTTESPKPTLTSLPTEILTRILHKLAPPPPSNPPLSDTLNTPLSLKPQPASPSSSSLLPVLFASKQLFAVTVPLLWAYPRIGPLASGKCWRRFLDAIVGSHVGDGSGAFWDYAKEVKGVEDVWLFVGGEDEESDEEEEEAGVAEKVVVAVEEDVEVQVVGSLVVEKVLDGVEKVVIERHERGRIWDGESGEIDLDVALSLPDIIVTPATPPAMRSYKVLAAIAKTMDRWDSKFEDGLEFQASALGKDEEGEIEGGNVDKETDDEGKKLREKYGELVNPSLLISKESSALPADSHSSQRVEGDHSENEAEVETANIESTTTFIPEPALAIPAKPKKFNRTRNLLPSSIAALSVHETNSLLYALTLILTHCPNLHHLRLHLPTSLTLLAPILRTSRLETLDIHQRVTEGAWKALFGGEHAEKDWASLRRLVIRKVEFAGEGKVEWSGVGGVKVLCLAAAAQTQPSGGCAAVGGWRASSRFVRAPPPAPTHSVMKAWLERKNPASEGSSIPVPIKGVLQSTLQTLDISCLRNDAPPPTYGYAVPTPAPKHGLHLLKAISNCHTLKHLVLSLSPSAGITVRTISWVLLPPLYATLQVLVVKPGFGTSVGDSTVDEEDVVRMIAPMVEYGALERGASCVGGDGEVGRGEKILKGEWDATSVDLDLVEAWEWGTGGGERKCDVDALFYGGVGNGGTGSNRFVESDPVEYAAERMRIAMGQSKWSKLMQTLSETLSEEASASKGFWGPTRTSSSATSEASEKHETVMAAPVAYQEVGYNSHSLQSGFELKTVLLEGLDFVGGGRTGLRFYFGVMGDPWRVDALVERWKRLYAGVELAIRNPR